MPVFKMTKFVKCEWRLKYNLYTPKCTYEHLKLKKISGVIPPSPIREGDTPPAPFPSTAFGCVWVAARPIVRTPNCPPDVPKRSDATVHCAVNTEIASSVWLLCVDGTGITASYSTCSRYCGCYGYNSIVSLPSPLCPLLLCHPFFTTLDLPSSPLPSYILRQSLFLPSPQSGESAGPPPPRGVGDFLKFVLL